RVWKLRRRRLRKLQQGHHLGDSRYRAASGDNGGHVYDHVGESSGWAGSSLRCADPAARNQDLDVVENESERPQFDLQLILPRMGGRWKLPLQSEAVEHHDESAHDVLNALEGSLRDLIDLADTSGAAMQRCPALTRSRRSKEADPPLRRTRPTA